MYPKVVCANREELVAALTRRFKELLPTKTLQQPFVLGLSGGSMPSLVCEALRPLSDSVQWSSVVAILCDERVVALDHADSNYAAYVSAGLLTLATGVRFLSADTDLPPAECAEKYADSLLQIARSEDGWPVCDALLLGLGPDGHTCSLFPGHQLLQNEKDIVAPILDSPKPPPHRITLTLPVLRHSQRCIWISTGQNKAEVVRDIFTNTECQLPGALVCRGTKNVGWFMDTEAASLI